MRQLASACDDPRVNATLYDFGAGALTQTPSRLQGQSDKARVVLQDMPEPQLLLGAYAALNQPPR
jgi:hypothetical protein